MPQPNMIVLYDGGCPMCGREILHYRRIAGDRPIDWIDVTQPDVDLAPFGLNREAALRLFHVVDRTGAMRVGARAFMALWAELPGYRWLSLAGADLPGIAAGAHARMGLCPVRQLAFPAPLRRG